MRLLESRRLTGRHLLLPGPGAATELELSADESAAEVRALLEEEARRIWPALELAPGGAEGCEPGARAFAGGLSFAVRAEIDRLYVAAGALEWAVESAQARLAGGAALPLDDALETLLKEREAELNPALLALRDEAARRGVPLLWDDDVVSVGYGARSLSFSARELPPLDEVPWGGRGAVPVALITGTNGKTTSTRLVARMAQAAGLAAGHTSTDGIYVGGKLVDEGDWTGPGGARHVLRHAGVDLAVLETARGGILRRGLPVERCDAALVTNVGEDHLGDYGVTDLAGMAEVKGLVGEAVHEGGRVVLNADDPMLVRFASRYRAPVTFFAEREDNPVLSAHLEAGGEGFFVDDGGALTFCVGDARVPFARVDEVPIAFGGAARHNVQNALGASALARALGLGFDAIAEGLRRFSPSLEDSPGRANLLEKGGVRLLLDFAHNPHGVSATLGFLAALRANDPEGARLTVITGQAGDRSDDDIRALCRVLVEGGVDRVILREVAGYLRGRAPGEVPAVFRGALLALGLDEDEVTLADGERAALSLALDEARAGDTVALLVHVEREPIQALLRERGWI